MATSITHPAPTAGGQRQAVLVLAALLAAHPELPAPYITISKPNKHSHVAGLEWLKLQMPGLAALEAWREALAVPAESLEMDGQFLKVHTAVDGMDIQMYAVLDMADEAVAA